MNSEHIAHSELRNGCTIDVTQDMHASNPITDNETHIVATALSPRYGYGYDETNYNDGVSQSDIVITRDTLKLKHKDILSALGYATGTTLLNATNSARRSMYSGADLVDVVYKMVEETLDDNKGSDYCDMLAELLEATGTHYALSVQGQGYSQGDYHYGVLAILVSDFTEHYGDIKPADLLSNQSDELTAWAYGDAYMYSVTDHNGETVDQCSGFIGSQDSETWSYMLNEARESADTYKLSPAHIDADNFETFVQSYLTTALWASTTEYGDERDDIEGKPLDEDYSADDIDTDTLKVLRAHCLSFYSRVVAFLETDQNDVELPADGETDVYSLAGHDFWLTSNGHGAGFWDGDWPKYGDMFTAISKAYPELTLYVSDSKIYV